MEPGDSMLHSQRLSNNCYPELNQADSLYLYLLILSSHLRLGLLHTKYNNNNIKGNPGKIKIQKKNLKQEKGATPT